MPPADGKLTACEASDWTSHTNKISWLFASYASNAVAMSGATRSALAPKTCLGVGSPFFELTSAIALYTIRGGQRPVHFVRFSVQSGRLSPAGTLWMDEILHHLRIPGVVISPINTNNQWFAMSVHRITHVFAS